MLKGIGSPFSLWTGFGLRNVLTIVSHGVFFVVMILRVNLTIRNELILWGIDNV